MDSISRNSRPDGAFVTCEAQLELCRQLPMCRVVEQTVSAREALDPRETLCASEHLMFRILQEKGPLLKRSAYQTLCLNPGMNKNTFNSVIRRSPIVAKHSTGFYRIAGASVSARAMEGPVCGGRLQTSFVGVGIADTNSYVLPTV
jgi:hypothetical protein